MRSQDLKKAKRLVRSDVLRTRDALTPAERSDRGEQIARRFLSLPDVEAARTVMLFWSFGSEVPTRPLEEALDARGVAIALPRIAGPELEARSYRAGDPLTPTTFGAMEPAGGALVPPSRIDVVVTPGVAFDLEGGRVGYGGGFYDRFFRRTRHDTVRAAIAFDVQVVDRPLPAGSFDLPVDVVVTETRTIRPHVPVRPT